MLRKVANSNGIFLNSILFRKLFPEHIPEMVILELLVLDDTQNFGNTAPENGGSPVFHKSRTYIIKMGPCSLLESIFVAGRVQ